MIKKINLWIRNIIEQVELLCGYFFIFKIRSIRTDKIISNYTSFPEIGEEIAIIMQGPIISKTKFTYETLKLYRKIYPNVTIILSTWVNTDQIILDEINQLNIFVITNELPTQRGHSNINLQLKSTISGFEHLNSHQVKYVLKTRTDQRIYSSENYLLFMINAQESFPIQSDYLEKRLIVCNLNMYRNRKYCVSDMFMFGTLNDMNLFWNIPYQEEGLIEDKEKEFFKNNLGEAYLINTFIKNIEFDIENTLPNSDLFLNSNFFIIDKNSIDLFWYKYNHNYERTAMIIDGKNDKIYSILNWHPMI